MALRNTRILVFIRAYYGGNLLVNIPKGITKVIVLTYKDSKDATLAGLTIDALGKRITVLELVWQLKIETDKPKQGTRAVDRREISSIMRVVDTSSPNQHKIVYQLYICTGLEILNIYRFSERWVNVVGNQSYQC